MAGRGNRKGGAVHMQHKAGLPGRRKRRTTAGSSGAIRSEPMYKAVTRGIQVTVRPEFLEQESTPRQGRFFWAYTVEIANLGIETVQLKTRHWRIIDGDGKLQEVRGPGVVGEEPVLKPGESFTYTSGCPLSTPHGSMSGEYQMHTQDGESFPVTIPAFPLDSPHAKRVVH
jgi:ApaG protein